MSGAMRRIGEYLGLLEDTGRYDEYDGDYDTTDTTPAVSAGRTPKVKESRPAPVPTSRSAGDRPPARPEW